MQDLLGAVPFNETMKGLHCYVDCDVRLECSTCTGDIFTIHTGKGNLAFHHYIMHLTYPPLMHTTTLAPNFYPLDNTFHFKDAAISPHHLMETAARLAHHLDSKIAAKLPPL